MHGGWLGLAALAWVSAAQAQGVSSPDAGALPPEPGAVAGFAAATTLGGYGELTYNHPSDAAPIVDLRRVVLFVGHNFGEHWRLYSEIEWEHAVASFSDRGEAEIEQAYLDYLHSDAFNVRAGLILMPAGIVNQQHEPPTFNGVDRPLVDTLIIPSTWREPGLGVWGRLGDFRYQLYLVDGFRATGFTADGIAEGHQEAQFALASSGAGIARLEWQPLNAFQLGATGYFGSANQGELPDGAGKLALGDLDAQLSWRGLQARGELAFLHVSGANFIASPDGTVGSTQYGLYVELGYDLLHPFAPASGQRLVVYGRYQRVDNNYRVEGGQVPSNAAEVQVFEGGLTWRPISEISLKADLRHFSRPLAANLDDTWFDLGLGWMF
jgi:hypothetical protein